MNPLGKKATKKLTLLERTTKHQRALWRCNKPTCSPHLHVGVYLSTRMYGRSIDLPGQLLPIKVEELAVVFWCEMLQHAQYTLCTLFRHSVRSQNNFYRQGEDKWYLLWGHWGLSASGTSQIRLHPPFRRNSSLAITFTWKKGQSKVPG